MAGRRARRSKNRRASHNVGAAEVGLSIGGKTLYAMERKAGFGRRLASALPGENPGIVPPPSAMERFVAGHDVVRTGRLGYAAGNGALLCGDRQRRIADAAAHRARASYDPQGKSRAALFSGCRSARLFAAYRRRSCATFLRAVVLARHGRSERTDSRICDRRKDRHRADGR